MEPKETEKEEKKKKPRRTGKTYWHLETTSILKGFMARGRAGPKVLSTKLEKELGIKEEVRPLRNKIARGSFSFIFFLQCMHALGKTKVEFDLDPSPPRPKKKPGEPK